MPTASLTGTFPLEVWGGKKIVNSMSQPQALLACLKRLFQPPNCCSI